MEEKTGFMGSSGAAGSRTSGSWKKRKSDYAGEAEISELGNRLCDHYGKLLGELRKSVSAMREADTAMRKSLAAYYEGVFRVYREMRMSHVHRHGCFSCLRLKLNSPRGDVVDPPHWQVILFMKGNCRLEYGLIINHQTGRCSAGRAGSRLMPWEKTYLGVIESFLADTRVFRQRMSSISRLTKSASKHIEDMERLLARLRCFSNGFEGIGTGREDSAPAQESAGNYEDEDDSSWYSPDAGRHQEGDEFSRMFGIKEPDTAPYAGGVVGPDGIRTI